MPVHSSAPKLLPCDGGAQLLPHRASSCESDVQSSPPAHTSWSVLGHMLLQHNWRVPIDTLAADLARSSFYKACMHTHTTSTIETFRPLANVRILSLALNLPGPAALLRCQQMGAQCTKLEPLPPPGHPSADAMHTYSPTAYAQLHAGMAVLHANLKTSEGQAIMHEQLAQTDVLLTSFRPSALEKLGLGWQALHTQYSQLNMVRIFGSTDPAEVDHAGHDLTYQAQAGLVEHGQMPPSLFADMSGALMASEAVLQAVLLRTRSGAGHCLDIGLAQAAQWLAWPRHWGMTTSDGDVGGAHAGYRVYRCLDGWVAVAALEPHFAQRLCCTVGLTQGTGSVQEMRHPATHAAIEAFMQAHTQHAIATMAVQSDIPLQLIAGDYK